MITIITGAGISEESGIPTFRTGQDGLWKHFDIDVVCNYYTFLPNYEKVHDFYNDLRVKLEPCKPNIAHSAIAEFKKFIELNTHHEVRVFTTNVDRLHEQAGCSPIHLHGDLLNIDMDFGGINPHTIDVGYSAFDYESIKPMLAKPAVIFFGEIAPNYNILYDTINDMMFSSENVVLVVGCSNQVLNFNQLLQGTNSKIFNVNPFDHMPNCVNIRDQATVGVPKAIEQIKEYLDIKNC